MGVWMLLLRRRDISVGCTLSRTNLTEPAPFLVSGNAWFKYSDIQCVDGVEKRSHVSNRPEAALVFRRRRIYEALLFSIRHIL